MAVEEKVCTKCTKEYAFVIAIHGYGKTRAEAYEDAIEAVFMSGEQEKEYNGAEVLTLFVRDIEEQDA